MRDWILVNAEWSLAILLGLVLAQTLFLASQFLKDSRGYLWLAAKEIVWFLVLLVLVEWIVASFFFILLKGIFAYLSFPLWLVGLIVGILTAFAPAALEVSALPREGATIDQIQKPLAKLLLKLNVVLRYNFASAIETCRRHDLYDLQNTDQWITGLTPIQIQRKLRIIYEACKEDIAENRHDPSLLQYDVDYAPWGKFYLLVRHLGRRKLRRYINENLISPAEDWDGSERRRFKGSSADRRNKHKLNMQRIYDDVELMKRIDRGRFNTEVRPGQLIDSVEPPNKNDLRH